MPHGAGDPALTAADLVAAGRHDDAADLVRHALTQSPDDPDLWALLSTALLRSGNVDSALAAAERAVRLAPNSAHAYAKMGDVHLFGTQRWKRAIVAYSRAAEIEPSVAAHLILRSQAASRLAAGGAHRVRWTRAGRSLAMARADARAALAIDPSRADAHVAHAWADLAGADASAALEHADHALRIDPTCTRAAMARGVALERLGDIEGASAAFVSVARADPRSPASLDHPHGVQYGLGVRTLLGFGLGISVLLPLLMEFNAVLGCAVAAPAYGWLVWWMPRRRRSRMVPDAQAALRFDMEDHRARLTRRVRRRA